MPVCQDCGNTEAFVHRVRGTETRHYDGDEHVTTTDAETLESEECWCANCESRNVVFDATSPPPTASTE